MRVAARTNISTSGWRMSIYMAQGCRGGGGHACVPPDMGIAIESTRQWGCAVTESTSTYPWCLDFLASQPPRASNTYRGNGFIRSR